jgi:hypothetical protein
MVQYNNMALIVNISNGRRNHLEESEGKDCREVVFRRTLPAAQSCRGSQKPRFQRNLILRARIALAISNVTALAVITGSEPMITP